MTEAPPTQKPSAPQFCQNFAFYGQCGSLVPSY